MRPPRDFNPTRPSRQHVYNRVAGSPDWHPFTDHGLPNEAGRRLMGMIIHFVRPYFCRMAMVVVMGNHYHLVLDFEARRQVDREELRRRARLMWGDRCRDEIQNWNEQQYQSFSDGLFEMPNLMRDLGGTFSRWFNRAHRRRGPLWADRYKNTELLDLEAVQECVLYGELNPPRAGLVALPEDWELSSARWRRQGSPLAQELIPLSELFPEAEQANLDVERWYRGKLLWRGTLGSKAGDRVIPEPVVRRELERGFDPGVYRTRRRFFTDGKALGQAWAVRATIQIRRDNGFYLRRRHPVSQLGGLLFSLREQRNRTHFLDWKPPGSGTRAPLPASRDGPG